MLKEHVMKNVNQSKNGRADGISEIIPKKVGALHRFYINQSLEGLQIDLNAMAFCSP